VRIPWSRVRPGSIQIGSLAGKKRDLCLDVKNPVQSQQFNHRLDPRLDTEKFEARIWCREQFVKAQECSDA
jgi:hypothetical protein